MVRLVLFVLIALPGVATLSACAGSGGRPGPPLGVSSPTSRQGIEMNLPRLGGGRVSISSLRGHPVLLVLFTTWSLRSQAEAPLIVQLQERYDGQGLKMVGVVLDQGTSLGLVQTYVEHVGFRFDVLMASPDNLELVGALGRTRAVPRTVLLDRKGQIVLDHSGQTNFRELESELSSLFSRRP